MTVSVPSAPPATPALDALPAALRQNVLGYAARKVRELEVMVKKAARDGAPADYRQILEKLSADGTLAADITAGTFHIADPEARTLLRVLAGEHRTMAEIEGLVAETAALEAGSVLANDKPLLTILAGISQHFQGVPESGTLETIKTQALEKVLQLQETDPKALRELSRKPLVSGISEAVSTVAKFADYRKLAFAGVAGVAVGAVMHKVLFPHKDPKDQPQLV